MHGFILSKHLVQRMQQRAIPGTVVEALVLYGERRKSAGGADKIYFTKRTLLDIKNDIGTQALKTCEKFKKTYLVVSDEGVIITAARTRRTVH